MNGKPSHQRLIWAVLLLLGLTAVLSGWSIAQRAAWFGRTTADIEGFETDFGVLALKNWQREGLVNLWFTIYKNPASIEHPTAKDREAYTSFPPGAIIPVYVITLLFGLEPTAALFMAYNLAIQFGVAFILGLLVLVTLRRMHYSYPASWVLACVPVILYLWLPSPFFEHQMGCYSDQFVMLPYALCVLLEALWGEVQDPRKRRILSVVQGVLLFWGMSTDWLFGPVALCLYAARAARGWLGRRPVAFVVRSVLFWLPVGLVGIILAAQIWHAGTGPRTREIFLGRMGFTAGVPIQVEEVPARPISFLNSVFWREMFSDGYGPLGKPLLTASVGGLVLLLLYFLVQKIRRMPPDPALTTPALILFMTLAPCFLYCLILPQHCSFFTHFFATLKFAVAMATVPLAILPATALRIGLPDAAGRTAWRRGLNLAMAALMVCLASGYVYLLREVRDVMFASEEEPDLHLIGRFVGAHTGYEDIVFSPDYATRPLEPMVTAYAMKQIYKVRAIQDVYEAVLGVDGEYVVDLFSRDPEAYVGASNLGKLAAITFEHVQENEMHLRRIRKRDFLALCQKLNDEGLLLGCPMAPAAGTGFLAPTWTR